MDRERFDALARLISTRSPRRSVWAVIFGAVILRQGPIAAEVQAKRGDRGRKRNARRRTRGTSGLKARRRAKRTKRQTSSEAARCCSRGACNPGAGRNLGKCCFEGQNLSGRNFKGANLGQANFSRAILAGANFTSANLGQTCFVDADISGARFTGANTSTSIFCRTQTDDGEDNSGCNRGTPCCPTCDADHPCADGELCCAGRCVAGDCCDTGEQSTCGTGELCCDHVCSEGVCCQAADCPNETCQRRTCEDHQCIYTPVFDRPGPRCPTPRVCCRDATGAPLCCPEGATTCDGQGLCCTAQSRDETCAVGTPAPKCGEVTNNCGQRIDCGPCAERICENGNCAEQGNTCLYSPVFGVSGPGCGTMCCRDAQGTPECCEAGTTRCFPSGGCLCANKQDCSDNEVCCDGSCETPIWTNETTFGSEGDGDSQFERIIGVAVSADEETAWIVDSGNSRVSVWSRQSNGQWENAALFGSSGSGLGQFNLPFGVAVSDDGLTAFVGDQGSSQTLEGSRVSVWRKQFNGSWTNPFSLGNGTGDGADQFEHPTGVAVSGDGQTLWVADTGNDRISVWTEDNGFWNPLTTFGGPGTGPGQFSDAVGVAVSGNGQTVWIIDRIITRVSVWNRQSNGDWTFDTDFGSFGDRADQWRGPLGVAVSADGQTAFVADLGHDRISIWTRQPNGEWSHELNVGNGEGSGRDQFSGPTGIAAAANGRTIWVSDQSNFRVSVWSLSGCPAPDG